MVSGFLGTSIINFIEHSCGISFSGHTSDEPWSLLAEPRSSPELAAWLVPSAIAA